MPQRTDLKRGAVKVSAGPRLRIAMIVAILADVLQIAVFPWVIEGAESPADDILDLCVGGLLTFLLGWHWEFLPSFAAKLIPGVDLVPLWTLAVANVYRKARAQVTVSGGAENQQPTRNNTPNP
ncbi:MAG: hypothetical protein ABSB50_11240 [Terracidiphilus sp.]|jgi:hypothetical protein